MACSISIVTTRHPDDAVMRDFYGAAGHLAARLDGGVELVVVNSLVQDGLKGGAAHGLPAVNLAFLELDRAAGQIGSILAGIRVAQGEYILSIDPDMGSCLPALGEMLNLARQGRAVVIGRRLDRQGTPRWRVMGSAFFNFCVSGIIGFRVHDLNSPMFLITRQVVEELAMKALPVESYKFRLFMDYRDRFAEVGVHDASGMYKVRSTYGAPELIRLFWVKLIAAMRLRMRGGE